MSLSASPRRFFGGEWTLASKRLPEPRYDCAYTSLGEDRHLLIGGTNRATKNLYRTRTVLEYNSTMDVLSSHTPLSKESNPPVAAIAIDDQRLLVVFVVGADSIVCFF